MSQGLIRKATVELWKDIGRVIVSRTLEGRFISWRKLEAFYRTSIGIKGVPISNKYYGFLIQAWSYDKELLEDLRENLENKLIKLMENFIRYSESEWWFYYVFGYEAPLEVEEDEDLDSTWVFYATEKGKILDHREGEFDEL